VRFSAATTAERFLPRRLALRIWPLLGLFMADDFGKAGARAFTVRRRLGTVMLMRVPAKGAA
jgi:hypothetical protein